LPEDKNQLLKNALLDLAATAPESGLLISKLAEIFFALHTISASSAPLADPRLKKVFSCLYQFTETTVSHLKLAKTVAISVSHLSRFFRHETGGTLRNFKLWQRTLNGTNLILQGKSITEASLEAGFADTAHFSRSFKRQFGISASTLKQHAKEVFCFDSDSDELLSDAIKKRETDDSYL
jgi:AraC-like DNA-binding protein